MEGLAIITDFPVSTILPGESSKFSVDNFLLSIYLLFGIIGIFANGLVLLVIVRVRSLWSITNLFIANQSLIDLTSSIFLILLKFLPNEVDFKGWSSTIRAFISCYFWQSDYIYWALLTCSTLNLCMLTLERFVAVIYPVFYRSRVKWKSALLLATAPWITGFTFELFWPAVFRFEDDECVLDYRTPTIMATIGVGVFLVKYVIPIGIMFFVYFSILKKMRPKVETDPSAIEDNGNMQSQPTTQNQGSSSRQIRIRINILKTLFLVSVTYIVCWTPNQIIFFRFHLGGPLDFQSAQYAASVSLAFCNMWINPFIYAFQYRKFQAGLRKLFSLNNRNESNAFSSTVPRITQNSLHVTPAIDVGRT